MNEHFSKSRKKRSLSIHGHLTSISLEPEFWSILDDAVDAAGTSLAAFLTKLDDDRTAAGSSYGLAAYLRLYALHYAHNRNT